VTRRRTASEGGAGREPILQRIRGLFTIFVGLVLLVEVVEWLDASTPLWPNRVVTAAAIVLAGVWAVALLRVGRATWWLDAAIAVTIVAAGWGLGRNGAVLALLIGVPQLRALYGRRWSVAAATVGLVAGYAVVTALTDGTAGLLDLGMVTVATGVLAIVVVIRLVGEALAHHDLAVAWDRSLFHATREMRHTTRPEEIDATITAALAAMGHEGQAASGGLVPVPGVPTSPADIADAIPALGDRGGIAADLAEKLDRLLADAALSRERLHSEQRFQLLAERSLDGIYLRALGTNPRIQYLNPSAQKLLGCDVDDLNALGNVPRSLLHPDDYPDFRTALRARGVISEPIQVRVLHDGEPVWLEVEETLVEAEHDGPPIVQGTLRDVTRQRLQEEALRTALERQREAADELRRLDQMKSTFLQAVSHELRTPLATVLGASATLEARFAALSHDEAQRLIEAIHRQASRLEYLLADLLDVERLAQGVVTPRRRPTALRSLVERVVATLDERVDDVTIDGEDVVVAVDGPKVERIVENLLLNALKHTPPATEIRVMVTAHADGALLVVEDDGPGIPRDLHATIFEPFVQGPASQYSHSPGTGIGLALVSRLAELHGGRAWLEDTETGGARFVVLLAGPADDAPRPVELSTSS
jgi:PAS domain S-box-containing protein